MKKWRYLVVVSMVLSANAETIILHNGGTALLTTGDHIDEADEVGRWTNVVEIAGLNIFARSGATNQDVNARSDSLGIDSDGSEDASDRFEDGESLTLAFDKDVEITRLDFRYFESNEVMVVSFEGLYDLTIANSNLSNRSQDYLDTNITVSAGTEFTFYVGNTNSVIGLQSLDVNLPGGTGELMLGLDISNDWIHVSAEFDGAPATNYVLLACTNLTSNVWNAVSGSFGSDTNWVMPVTNRAVYFRAAGE